MQFGGERQRRPPDAAAVGGLLRNALAVFPDPEHKNDSIDPRQTKNRKRSVAVVRVMQRQADSKDQEQHDQTLELRSRGA